jgi:hypothetical protein
MLLGTIWLNAKKGVRSDTSPTKIIEKIGTCSGARIGIMGGKV